MSTTIPTTMHALIAQEDHTAAIKEVPVPTLGHNEILVKVQAVALNPTDWKHVRALSTGGQTMGCDFAGTIVKLGEGITNTDLKEGDHVSGFTHGGYYTDRGSFAEFTKVESNLVWKIPSKMSQEEASTMNCGLWTVIQGLYQRLNLPLPTSPISSNEWFFVYGGSTSVGQYAIQLAHASGYKVATVASPKNHELLKSLGADAVFDYNSPTAVDDIKAATGDSIHYSIDTISLDDSQVFTVKVHGTSTPLKSIILLPRSDKINEVRTDVETETILLYSALGRPWEPTHIYSAFCAPSFSDDRAFMSAHLHLIPKLIEEGKLQASPVKLFEGGLDGVNEGLQYLQDGKVSAEKIVLKF